MQHVNHGGVHKCDKVGSAAVREVTEKQHFSAGRFHASVPAAAALMIDAFLNPPGQLLQVQICQ